VETIQNLLVQSNSHSVLQWRDQVKRHVTGLDELFYSDGQFVSDKINNFNEAASLIVMGDTFNSDHLHHLLALLNNENADTIRLHAPEVMGNLTVMRFVLSANPQTLKANIDKFCKEHKMDFALMPCFPDWSKPGLVLMDMDSTTIQIECIDEIARLYNVGDQVAAVTELAMQGKLDFNESLRTRVSKLKGAPVSILEEVADNLPLMPGLLELIKGLKTAGWKVAIASGGFNYFADRLKEDYGFDAAISNALEIKDQTLTGEVHGEIVNASVKKRTLSELAERFDIPMSQTVAIGDGANDLLMLDASAIGIAIHAKPIVQEKAPVSLNHVDLQGALCILSASNAPGSWS
jgi:phosphoserine phosphatase